MGQNIMISISSLTKHDNRQITMQHLHCHQIIAFLQRAHLDDWSAGAGRQVLVKDAAWSAIVALFYKIDYDNVLGTYLDSRECYVNGNKRKENMKRYLHARCQKRPVRVVYRSR